MMRWSDPSVNENPRGVSQDRFVVFAYDGRGLIGINPEQLLSPTALALSRFGSSPDAAKSARSGTMVSRVMRTRFRRVFARHPRERAETSSLETSRPSLVVRVAPLRCREVRGAAYIRTLTISANQTFKTFRGAISRTRRAQLSGELLLPVKVSERAWPDIHASISRVEGPCQIAAETNTFASMTTPTGSALPR